MAGGRGPVRPPQRLRPGACSFKTALKLNVADDDPTPARPWVTNCPQPLAKILAAAGGDQTAGLSAAGSQVISGLVRAILPHSPEKKRGGEAWGTNVCNSQPEQSGPAFQAPRCYYAAPCMVQYGTFIRRATVVGAREKTTSSPMII